MIGRRDRDIASPPRLRFSPLEIFAQRQLQPILARILCGGSGLPLGFILVILHRGPVSMRLSSNDISGEDNQMSEISALAPPPQWTLNGRHRFVGGEII